MAISITRYVDITSGVAAGVVVSARELIGRLFSASELIPTGGLVEVESSDDAVEYFGAGSPEALQAAHYFGWVSKNITRPKKLGFFRWVESASPAAVFGGKGAQTLGTIAAIANGRFTITLDGVAFAAEVDFTGAASLSAAAALIQTEIRSAFVAPLWSSCLVTWDSVAQRFVFEAGTATDATVSITEGVGGTPIASLLKWLQPFAIWSDGVTTPQTVTEVLIQSADVSNNFGSFAFMPDIEAAEVTEAAVWTNGENVRYMFSHAVEADEIATVVSAVGVNAGCAISLAAAGDTITRLFPMMILAATDYERRNSVQNYMFQIDDRLTVTVSSNADANIYDDLRVNYYGQTQQAGAKINFYQRGKLLGPVSAPLDMNTFANEMWLKDAQTVAIMSLLLNQARISANAAGRSQVLATLQGPINQGLFNGSISVGKPLNNDQKQYISSQTGDPLAWYAVQNNGYWVDAFITKVDDEFKITYILIYSKDDIVRKVEGSHQLI